MCMNMFERIDAVVQGFASAPQSSVSLCGSAWRLLEKFPCMLLWPAFSRPSASAQYRRLPDPDGAVAIVTVDSAIVCRCTMVASC